MGETNRIEGVNKVFMWTVFTYLFAPVVMDVFLQVTKVSLGAFGVILFSQGMLVLPTAVYIASSKINLVEFVRLKKISILNVVLVIILSFTVMPFMSLINALSMLVFTNHIGGTIESMVSQTNFVLCFLAVGIIPSIFEELVYRGVFYNEYRKVNVRKGILLSALLFGLLHMNFNQFFYAFAMGVIFALVIEATDSIVSTMVMHLTINGSSLLAVKMMEVVRDTVARNPEQYGEFSDVVSQSSTALTKSDILATLPALVVQVIFCSAIAVGIYYLIAKRNGRLQHVKSIFAKEAKQEEKRVPLVNVYLLLAIIICIVCMIVLR